ncbi:MAG: hypothetical protein FRX49_04013 [Trebouxia sp. A1-2]|nr:MAG: hypothetical protein FRX49_04013 [Trebouxia sp. A1-2]
MKATISDNDDKLVQRHVLLDYLGQAGGEPRLEYQLCEKHEYLSWHFNALLIDLMHSHIQGDQNC